MLQSIKKFKYALKNEKGLSLIEVVLIIVIMGISILPLTRLGVTNLTGTVEALRMSKAQFYGKMLMDEVIGDYLSLDRSVGGLTNVMSAWDDHTESGVVEGMNGSVKLSSQYSLGGVMCRTVTVTVTDIDTGVLAELVTIFTQLR